MHRSYLFAPGHNPKLLRKVFEAGADAVILDLEDAVPAAHKGEARQLVAAALRAQLARASEAGPSQGASPGEVPRPQVGEVPRPAGTAWVRVNAARTAACAADLDAVAEHAAGIRVPKEESAEDVRWVADRARGKPLLCAIETARGVLAAQEIAAVPSVRCLALGGVDLRRDLNIGAGEQETIYVRSHLVVVSRAAGLEPPVDSVYVRLDDAEGLRREAHFARRLGFFGKSAIHPRQLPVLHDVFTPSADELAWAERAARWPEASRALRARGGVAAFAASGGAAVQLADGEFVDLPVAQRARRLLELAATVREGSITPRGYPLDGHRRA